MGEENRVTMGEGEGEIRKELECVVNKKDVFVIEDDIESMIVEDVTCEVNDNIMMMLVYLCSYHCA